jgi:predicted DNA-binding transcriptional regulator AlpA
MNHPPASLDDVLAVLREVRDLLADRKLTAASTEASADDFIDLRELARMAGTSLVKAKRLKAAGALPPHVEHGARLHRWRRRDVQQWLDDGVGQTRRRKGRAAKV